MTKPRSKPGPAKGTPRKPYGPTDSEIDFIWGWLLDPVRPPSFRMHMVLFHPDVPDRVIERLVDDSEVGVLARHRLEHGCRSLPASAR